MLEPAVQVLQDFQYNALLIVVAITKSLKFESALLPLACLYRLQWEVKIADVAYTVENNHNTHIAVQRLFSMQICCTVQQ